MLRLKQSWVNNQSVLIFNQFLKMVNTDFIRVNLTSEEMEYELEVNFNSENNIVVNKVKCFHKYIISLVNTDTGNKTSVELLGLNEDGEEKKIYQLNSEIRKIITNFKEIVGGDLNSPSDNTIVVECFEDIITKIQYANNLTRFTLLADFKENKLELYLKNKNYLLKAKLNDSKFKYAFERTVKVGDKTKKITETYEEVDDTN